MEHPVTDEPAVEVDEVEEYEPRDMQVVEGAVAVPDLDALADAVRELHGGEPLAWQFSEAGYFALLYVPGKLLTWRNVEFQSKPGKVASIN